MPHQSETGPSKTEQIARDIEVIALAYSRSLNAMNNMIQMQVQDILDVSIEVRREVIEMDELEEYLEKSELGEDLSDEEISDLNADEQDESDEENDDAKTQAKQAVAEAATQIKAVAETTKSEKKAPNPPNPDPVSKLVIAASDNIALAMANTMNVQNQLNSIAIAALSEGLALIYGYDEEDDELDGDLG